MEGIVDTPCRALFVSCTLFWQLIVSKSHGGTKVHDLHGSSPKCANQLGVSQSGRDAKKLALPWALACRLAALLDITNF
jgi:hypothetical protein